MPKRFLCSDAESAYCFFLFLHMFSKTRLMPSSNSFGFNRHFFMMLVYFKKAAFFVRLTLRCFKVFLYLLLESSGELPLYEKIMDENLTSVSPMVTKLLVILDYWFIWQCMIVAYFLLIQILQCIAWCIWSFKKIVEIFSLSIIVSLMETSQLFSILTVQNISVMI